MLTQNQSSEKNSFAIWMKLFIVATLAVHFTAGVQTCFDKNIRQVCDCSYYPTFAVQCSYKRLKEYPDFRKIQNVVERLDVSYNGLSKFPTNFFNFHALDTLNLSHNNIELVPQNVTLPGNLRHLNLSYNNIKNWLNLNPNALLRAAPNLETLILAGNPLDDFVGDNEQTLLVSNTLKKLDLSDCQIDKITDTSMLSGLANLDQLILRSNPLYNLPDFEAEKLTILDVSDCRLISLQRTMFSQMPRIKLVNFSGNHYISFTDENGRCVESKSLQMIDLSRCNITSVELNGFPNLTTAILKENRITELTDNSFRCNDLIEKLDLSFNEIDRISVAAFYWMERLRTINLSSNKIRKIESNTFARHYDLRYIDLSRNNIERLQRISCPKLEILNMSRCKIDEIDVDALRSTYSLRELDLSYNFFTKLPKWNGFSSSLQILDLSHGRLSHIGTQSFTAFPKLISLNLAGNYLTNTFRKEHFKENHYLKEIWLGDNPWNCECGGESIRFYVDLSLSHKLKDRLLCHTNYDGPGLRWDSLCDKNWYYSKQFNAPNEKSSFDNLLPIAIAILIVSTLLFLTIFGLKWWRQYRSGIRAEQLQQENSEITRELMRPNQSISELGSQTNVPTLWETSPPCYEDAIHMPKPMKATRASEGNKSMQQ